MKVLAVIPARGGSKGLPGKNIRSFGGVPLVGIAVQAAVNCEAIDKVVVSSDDEAILGIASSYGAQPLRRPDELATDTATTEDALSHVLQSLPTHYDVLVLLQCTSPFTTTSHVADTVRPILTGAADSSLSVLENHGFLWSIDESGEAVSINHNFKELRRRRQDLPPQFLESGAVYAMRTDLFRETGNRFCGRVKPVLVCAPAIEIDNQQDWVVAEAIRGAQYSQDAAIPRGIVEKFGSIKALMTDFDGVHTDDAVYISESGQESVRCNRSDGMGVEMLRNAGLPVLILSKETNKVVTARAKKLKVDVIQGVDDKVSALSAWLDKQNLTWEDVAYIGNDINDIGCLERAGFAAVPCDANAAVLIHADWVLPRAGGNGAIRAFADVYLSLMAKQD